MKGNLSRIAARTASLATICSAMALTAVPVWGQQGSTPDALRPGDAIRLQLTIAGEGQNYDGEYIVDEAGMVALPLIGPQQVTGIPPQELRRRIVSEYETLYHDQTIGITLLRRISVLGAVRTPGLYHVDPTVRVAEVIAMAGGVTNDGKQDEVRILRDGREIVTDITPSSTLPAELRSGDQVFVPAKNWFARNPVWLVGVGTSILAIILRNTR